MTWHVVAALTGVERGGDVVHVDGLLRQGDLPLAHDEEAGDHGEEDAVDDDEDDERGLGVDVRPHDADRQASQQ